MHLPVHGCSDFPQLTLLHQDRIRQLPAQAVNGRQLEILATKVLRLFWRMLGYVREFLTAGTLDIGLLQWHFLTLAWARLSEQKST